MGLYFLAKGNFAEVAHKIFEFLLTTFEAIVILGGNWCSTKNQTTLNKFNHVRPLQLWETLCIMFLIYRKKNFWSHQLPILSTFYLHIFCTKFWHQKLQKLCFGFEIFGAKISYEKCTRKTLMKLTAVHLDSRWLLSIRRNSLNSKHVFLSVPGTVTNLPLYWQAANGKIFSHKTSNLCLQQVFKHEFSVKILKF